MSVAVVPAWLFGAARCKGATVTEIGKLIDVRPEGHPAKLCMTKIRTLIVDDEPLARERIRALMSDYEDLEVVAEARNGEEAAEAIFAHEPDLVFLDIQMPRMDGFEVIRTVGPEHLPLVVFVTAYDQHALKAFKVRALDYLLKPFDRDRFAETIGRVRQALDRPAADEIRRRLRELVRTLTPVSPQRTDRLVIKSAGRLFFLRAEEVDWVEASGNYVKLHVGSDEYLLRERISALEQQLDPSKFVRIHRSRIVNLDRVEEMQPCFNGEYLVTLRDGTRLTLSRGYRGKLHEELQSFSYDRTS